VRPTLDIALNELRLLFRERGIWLNLVIIPIVISLAVGFANGLFSQVDVDGPDVRIDVIDEDNSPLSAELIRRLDAANASLLICPMQATAEADPCGLNGETLTPERAGGRLEDGATLALIIIPAGFEQNLNSGETATLVYRANEDASAPSYILQAVQAAAEQVGGAASSAAVGGDIAETLFYVSSLPADQRAELDTTIRENAASLWARSAVSVTLTYADQTSVTAGVPTATNGGLSQSIPGIGSMYVMFVIFPAIAALILERKQWTFQRMMVMPIRRANIMSGKMGGRFVIGMIQFGVLFGFGFLLGVRYGGEPLALVLLMMAYVLSITALTLMLATFLRTEQQAMGVTLFLTLTLAPLGGAWWPLEIVPQWMQTLGHISPVAWVMDGFHELIFFNGGLADVLPFIGVLLLMAGAFFLIGIVRFRYE
jgi:ABC-2 type transport system permease protein